MPRFFQAPNSVPLEQYRPPVSGMRDAAGGKVGEGLMPDLEVLPVDREEFLGIMGNYQSRMDEFASHLQRDPNSLDRLRPKMQGLQREVRQEFLHGRGAELLNRRKEAFRTIDEVRTHYKENPWMADSEIGSYLDNFTAGGPLDESRVTDAWGYDVNIDQLDGKMADMAKDVGSQVIQDMELEGMFSSNAKTFMSFSEIQGKAKERIAQRLWDYLHTDPAWKRTFGNLASGYGLSEEEINELIHSRVDSISSAMAEETKKYHMRESIDEAAKAAARGEGKLTSQDLQVFKMMFDATAGADNPQLEWNVATDYETARFILGESPIIMDYDWGGEDVEVAVSEVFSGQPVGTKLRVTEGGSKFDAGSTDMTATAGRFVRTGKIPTRVVGPNPEFTSITNPEVQQWFIDRFGESPVIEFKPNKSYLEVKVGGQSAWVETTKFSLPSILAHSAGTLNKNISEALNPNLDAWTAEAANNSIFGRPESREAPRPNLGRHF